MSNGEGTGAPRGPPILPPPPTDDEIVSFDIESVAYTSSPPGSPQLNCLNEFLEMNSVPMMPMMPVSSLPMMPMTPLSSSSDSVNGCGSPTSPSPAQEATKGVIHDDEGHVKFAPQEVLIQAIVSDNFIDKNFNETFVLTHNLYMSDLDVIQAISDHAFAPEIDASRMHLRIVVFLKTWVEKLWDASTDTALVDAVRELLGKLRPTCPKNAIDTLERLISRKLSGEETKSLYEFQHPPPRPLIPPAAWLGGTFPTVSLFTVHPIELARQMTLLEQDLFRSVRPWEFQNLAFSKKDKTRAPNIYANTQYFNKVSRWIAWDILGCGALPDRIYMLESAIELAHQFRLLQNFNAVNEVISALNSSAIHRLHATWAGLSQKAKDHFQEFCDLMAPQNNSQALRNAIKNLEPPCVPYLGIYLTDLTFIEEGNPTMKDNNVNWQKCARQAEIIVKIQTYQSQPYCLKRVPEIIEFLRNLNPDMDENAIWERSLAVEPREKAPKNEPGDAAQAAASEHDMTYGGAVPETFFSAADLASARTKVVAIPPGLKEGVELVVPNTAKGSDLKELVVAVFKKKGVIKADVPTSKFKLIVGASRERPSGMIVNDSFTLQDVVADVDAKKEKEAMTLALCNEVLPVDAQYLSAFNLSSIFQVLLDPASPLFGNELFIKNVLSFTKEEGYALLKVDVLSGKMFWVNSNFSLTEQGFDFKEESKVRLVVVPMSRMMRSENEDVAKIIRKKWSQNPNTRSGFLMHVKERGLLRPGIPPRTMLPQAAGNKTARAAAGVFEKKQLWYVAVDNFLIAYNDASSGVPEGFVLLDQYRASIGTLINGQLCVILRPHANTPFQFSRSKPLIYVGNNDNSTRQWYYSLLAKSCYNINTIVFGKSVEELIRRPDATSLVPEFVFFVCKSLYRRALDNSTLFSAPVNPQLLDNMRCTIDSGSFPELQSPNDDIALAQLLVSFLAEMPEGLIPSDMVSDVWNYSFGGGRSSPETVISRLNDIIQRLPVCNAVTLRCILEFFATWLSVSGCHDDPAEFLGPILMKPPEEGSSTLYKPAIIMDVTVTLISDMIINIDKLTFPGGEEEYRKFAALHPPLEPAQAPVVPLSLFRPNECSIILDAVMTARPLPLFDASLSGKRQTSAGMISHTKTASGSPGTSGSPQTAMTASPNPQPQVSPRMFSPSPVTGTSPPANSGVSSIIHMSPGGPSSLPAALSSVLAASSGSPGSPSSPGTLCGNSSPSPGVTPVINAGPQSSPIKSSLSGMDLSIDGEISFAKKSSKRKSPGSPDKA